MDGNGWTDSSILEYNPGTEQWPWEWPWKWTMKERKYGHAVSIISYKDYAAWCE